MSVCLKRLLDEQPDLQASAAAAAPELGGMAVMPPRRRPQSHSLEPLERTAAKPSSRFRLLTARVAELESNPHAHPTPTPKPDPNLEPDPKLPLTRSTSSRRSWRSCSSRRSRCRRRRHGRGEELPQPQPEPQPEPLS